VLFKLQEKMISYARLSRKSGFTSFVRGTPIFAQRYDPAGS